MRLVLLGLEEAIGLLLETMELAVESARRWELLCRKLRGAFSEDLNRLLDVFQQKV